MATSNFARWWPATIAGGALVHTRINERRLYAALVEMDYGQREVWWTSDGTSAGTSLFGNLPPWVEVIGTEPDRRLWSQHQNWGAIWPREVEWAAGAFSQETIFTSSRWKTTLRAFGRAAANFQDGERIARTFMLYALGTD